MNNEENESGFISHLTELRKRLIHSFVFLFIGSPLSFDPIRYVKVQN